MRAIKLFVLIITLSFSLLSYGEKQKLQFLIKRFEFKDFPKELQSSYSPHFGDVLASEVQTALLQNTGVVTYTWEDLQDQLKLEQTKELLQCKEDNMCVQKIIENFGMSDFLAGTVTYLSKTKLHIKLTHFSEDRVVNSVTKIVPLDKDKLIEEVKNLARKLMKKYEITESETNISINPSSQPQKEQTAKYKKKIILEIKTDPPKASIEINGKPVGITPYANFFEEGTYKIKVSKPFYLPAEREVVLTKKQRGKKITVKIKLEPNFGKLEVYTTPEDAKVNVDGEFKGTTPIKIKKISPGLHTIKLTKDHYFEKTFEIEVKRNQTYKVNEILKGKNGYLNLIAKDKDGNVIEGDFYIDGKKVGKVPFQGEILEGKHKFEIRSKDIKSGYYIGYITIKQNETKDMVVNINKSTGSAQLSKKTRGNASISAGFLMLTIKTTDEATFYPDPSYGFSTEIKSSQIFESKTLNGFSLGLELGPGDQSFSYVFSLGYAKKSDLSLYYYDYDNQLGIFFKKLTNISLAFDMRYYFIKSFLKLFLTVGIGFNFCSLEGEEQNSGSSITFKVKDSSYTESNTNLRVGPGFLIKIYKGLSLSTQFTTYFGGIWGYETTFSTVWIF